jgi:3-oxoadipate enol-lactonase
MSLGYEVQGTGPVVFMVHGLGGSSNTFQPQALSLAKRYRVVRPDLPGAGRSASKPAGTLISVADSLIALAGQLGVTSAHWVGHSLGSVVCQILASRHSESVKSLSLLGPIHEATPAAREALVERAAKVRAEGLDWFVDNYITNSLSHEVIESNPAVGAFLRESLLRQSAAQYADFCIDLASHKAVALENLAARTLLLTGDEDKVGTVASVTQMSKEFPAAVMQVVKACGHWLTVERPADVTAALETHLESAERRSP